MVKLKKRTMNYIVDDLIYPQIRKHPELKAVDILLHFLIEDDLPMSLKKTIHYNVPPLVDRLFSNKTNRAGRKRRHE